MKNFYKKSKLNNIYTTNIEEHNRLINESFKNSFTPFYISNADFKLYIKTI